MPDRPAPPAPPAAPSRRRGVALTGLMLAGYGGLVLSGVLPHDSPAMGALSLVLGLALLAFGLPTVGAPRARFVALLGACCVGGTIGYAVARPNGLGGPEIALLAYGVLLMAASFHLDRRSANGRFHVASAIGWSFPVLLAPLALFALNASLSSPSTGAAAGPVVQTLVVGPTAAALQLLGTPVERVGSSLVLATPRGTLSLGVGLVCAGLYPAVLFGGLVGLHAWTDRVPTRRLAVVFAAGIAGLWGMNVLRLVVLARIGIRWGMDALQTAHANLGWILFAGFMALFWALALRAPARRRAAPPADA